MCFGRHIIQLQSQETKDNEILTITNDTYSIK